MTPENYSFGKESLWFARFSGVELKNVVIVLARDLSTEGGIVLVEDSSDWEKRGAPL